MLTFRRKTFVIKDPVNEKEIADTSGQIFYKYCNLLIGTIVWTGAKKYLPRTWSRIKLKMPDYEEENVIFSLDNDETDCYELCLLCDFHMIKGIIESKVFDYTIDINNAEVNITLYINTCTIESRTSLRERRAIRSLMYQVFKITDQSIDDEPVLSAHDINLNDLFDKVIETRKSKETESNESDNFATTLQLQMRMKKKLYPYQEQAISWMVNRELSKDGLPSTPSLYQTVTLCDGNSIYYNPYRNHILVQQERNRKLLHSGGLLCDEMGLGKTVEVLGCILLHKRRVKTVKTRNEGRRVISSSESSEDDEGVPLNLRLRALRLEPTIKRPSKVRIPQVEEEKEVNVRVPLLNSRIPEAFKRRGQPSTLFQALQSWYSGKLSTYNETERMRKTDRKRDIEISCVCGIVSSETSSELVKCSECVIHQHAACFGYKTKRHSPNHQYICSTCWKDQPLLKSRATLIVCPPRLISQWQREIRKHVRGELLVFVYLGGSRSYPVYPTELLRYDVVLTTYTVLQNDLLLMESGGKALRQRARYCAPAAPIANVNWWRLVLDEAQLVETPTRSVSKMARTLVARNRWAVSGTPVTKGLEDLLGIIDYLILEPYTNADVWYFKLMRPYLTDDEAPMLNFLAKILWRTEKRHIQNQINIPKQTFEVNWLDFNQIESFFYAREYEASKSLFIEKLDTLNLPIQTPIQNLPLHALSNILAPVLTLRHACSHFSAVKGRYLASRKPLNSLTDLLDALVHKNSVDFEDNMRIAISAWNGMAGIHLLLENSAQAVNLYKKVLKLRETLREPTSSMKVEMDNLQVIHSLHNLITLVEEKPSLGLEHTDNIVQFKEDRLKHEKLFIAKFDVETLKAKIDFDEAETAISNVVDECDFDEIWDVYQTVDWLVKNGMYSRFVKMMENHPLMTEDKGLHRLKIGLHLELLSMLDRWQKDLTNVRDVCVTGVIELADFSHNADDKVSLNIASSTVTDAVECHLRISSQTAVANGEKLRCNVCTSDRLLNDYEALLYNKRWKPITLSAASHRSCGNWAPSLEEIALQCIARLGAQQPEPTSAETKRKGHAQKLLLDGMRKELKAARALWLRISYSVNSRDELNSCKMRLDLSPEDDMVVNEQRNNVLRNLVSKDNDRLERIHLLNRHELDYQHARLNNEAEVAVREFERLLGTNLYLSTLRGKDARAGGEGRALDPCPICRNDLQSMFHMMPCGHCYCVNCMHTLAQDGVRNTVSCAVCRNRHHLKDINYLQIKSHITTGYSNEINSAEDTTIKGNCSTKLAAVIRLVLRLVKENPTVKVLIYSIWNTVLSILLQALRENEVSAVHMNGNNDRHLEQFRDATKNVTALLLRISSGSKGLTLIEATHVIFLEPVLDPSDELQAISRVHRIGQTRPTVVHRFLMKDSIDESIYNVTNRNASKSIGWKETTIAQLKELYTHSHVM